MKKLLAILLALTMILSLAACQMAEPAEDETSDSSTNETTDPAAEESEESEEPADGPVAAGTPWNAVDEFHTEEDAASVWQYYFYDPSDSSFNPMGCYSDHDGSGNSGWYPWESSWVGIGQNAEVPDYLEFNCESSTAMAAVLGFVAPADGNYVVTGAVYNPWGQPADLFTVAKEDGTVVTTEDITQLVEVNGYLTPTDVELKTGDVVYFYCLSTDASWVSAYADITVYFEPTDPNVYEKPEVVIPEPEPPVVPAVEGALYDSVAEFNQETADGTWVYAYTTDGVNYTLCESFDTPDWNADGAPDAAQWYSAAGTGIGMNNDVPNWLEANVTNSLENGGEITALGFKAPEAGTYTLHVFTQNLWEQNGDHVVVCVNGEEVASIPFEKDAATQTVDVTLEAGQIAYVHGTSNGDWVSAYISVFVTQG